jgi:hypothetical protein
MNTNYINKYNNKQMFLFGGFYTAKDIHKLLLRKLYSDYNEIMNKYRKKYPIKGLYYSTDDIEKFSEERKTEWDEHRINVNNAEYILILNLLCFCENYPDELVSKSRWIVEYKDFPYRLEENVM